MLFLKISFVDGKSYGFETRIANLVLSKRSTDYEGLLYKATMDKNIHPAFGDPLKIDNLEFLTHFSACKYNNLNSSNLEMLATACPNF